MADSALLQLPSGPAAVVVRVQPVVLFNISDSYIRRPDGQGRVIGTLLGTNASDGTVDVRNSYAVPHSETSDGVVAVDIEYHRGMLELCSRVNAKEVVVGWYSTGSGVSSSDALIQDFFGREAPGAVHITVDTELSGVDGHGGIAAYVGTTLALGDRQVAAQFHQVQLDLRMMEAERIGFENLKKTVVERVPTDLDGLEATVGRLSACLDTVFHHVDAVLDGRIEADGTIGRYLADTVAALPKASPDGFQAMLQDGIQVSGGATWQAAGRRLRGLWEGGDVALGMVQDLLLVLYLANLTRAQLSLAEKLNTAAQPL